MSSSVNEEYKLVAGMKKILERYRNGNEDKEEAIWEDTYSYKDIWIRTVGYASYKDVEDEYVWNAWLV